MDLNDRSSAELEEMITAVCRRVRRRARASFDFGLAAGLAGGLLLGNLFFGGPSTQALTPISVGLLVITAPLAVIATYMNTVRRAPDLQSIHDLQEILLRRESAS
ncbi:MULTISPECIES: hypothetical protein [unclassified Rathayibacter]|uniref:hypothetical protein n=1 Tax=unclassified Rathayibacter TaxID=2609250 RepID=UPI0011AFE150|nr:MULTISPECIES: hypothetical protein [unclassified Rathayibacter]NQX06911.1 hypothetical protein [Rathayibacter sp. VKM Ac-2858]NQX22110.1 hypothetical protein [Rathayibacter sp. VKM Ac-2856]